MALLLCAGMSNVMADGVTVTWPFTSDVTTVTTSPDNVTASCAAGTGLTANGTSSYNEVTYLKFQPSTQQSSATSTDVIKWTVNVPAGYTFKPSTVSSNILRFGTDGGNIDVAYSVDGGEEVSMETGIVPARNKADANPAGVSSFSETFSDVTASSSLTVIAYVYNLGTNKQVGFNNVVITGTLESTATGTEETFLSVEDIPTLDLGGTKTAKVNATLMDWQLVTITDAKLSYSSSNEEVATVSEDGIVTAVGEGTANIVVSFAGDDTYMAVSHTTSVTVNDSRDNMLITLSSSKLTLAPGANGSVTVTYKNDTGSTDGDTGELTITNSNASAVTATLSGTELTINAVSAGSATITISSAESDTQKGASATLTVTVCEPLTAITEGTFSGATSSTTYTSQTNVDNIMIYATSSKNVKVSSSGYYLSGGASVSDGVINPCGLEVLVKGPVSITVTQNADNGRTLKVDAGTENLGTTTTTGSDVTETFNYEGTDECSIYIYSGGSGITVKSIVIAPLKSETKTIAAAKTYTTHCYSEELDFSSITDAKPYYVSGLTSTTATLAKYENDIVPAGAGFILWNQSESGATSFDAVVSSTSASAPTTNFLVGVTEDTEIEKGQAYILVDGTFVPASAGTFPANKAYLDASTLASGAKVAIVFDGTTGINEVKKAAANNGKIYNLQGIEVKDADKGLFIINGKKVIK